MNKRSWQALMRRLMQGVMVLSRILPWRLIQALGDGLGTLAYGLSARYRNVADKNLQIAFGETLSREERKALTRRTYRGFARAMAEFLKAPMLTPEGLRALVRSDVGMAPAKALLTQGHGLIVVTAHFGNWELLARRATIEGVSLLVVARQAEDAEFNRLTDSLRGNGGYSVHPRGASPKALLQHLRREGAVAILPDQKSEDVFVPFFGKLAGTVAGPAVLALKTRAPILPMFCPRQPDGTYRVEFGEAIDTTPTGDMDADTHRIMAEITRSIEAVIRRYPDQWLWMHDRWRVPPPERYRVSVADAEAVKNRNHRSHSLSDGAELSEASGIGATRA
jgi:KDO2-lipid IV(A) lauroyltransferase